MIHMATRIWTAVSQLIPPPEAWGDDPRNQEAARQVSEVVSVVTTPAEDTLSLFRQYVGLAVQAAHERGQEERD